MSMETNRWTRLADPQASFFADHLDATSQTAFSQTAHYAGIVPLRATTYDFELSQCPHNTVVWRDPYAPNSLCALTTSRYGIQPSSFVHFTESNDGYAVEGIAVRLSGSYGEAVNLYGQQQILRSSGMEDRRQVAVDFLDAGMQRASVSVPSAFSTESGVQDPRMVGVEGSTIARVFRSLNSFNANLIVGGVMAEEGACTDRLYDLAQGLLKVAIAGINRNGASETDNLLVGMNRAPDGAVFESARHGITVVRRMQRNPNTIMLATAERPKLDVPEVIIAQHLVQSTGARLDVTTIPATRYNPRSIVEKLMPGNTAVKQADAMQIPLDGTGEHVLERKIIGLLLERTHETV